MSWGFLPGRTYHRRNDIHKHFSGQQQGGIITPANHNLVILITGSAGEQHGYGDRIRDDGVFEYFGEGQVGDMQMVRGNKRILEHSEQGRDLLLFQKVNKGLRFEGEFVCQGFHNEIAPDTEGNSRQAIVFELVPIEALSEDLAESPPAQDELRKMREKAYEAARSDPRKRSANSSLFERSRVVRDYVLARANGRCEYCQSTAPFITTKGSPFLEVHHIMRLSDGGPDSPEHLIGLCPNCHRQAHYGADREACNEQMAEISRKSESAPTDN